MKKVLIAILLCMLTACASVTGSIATPQSTQAAYVQACSAYGTAFSAALQLRIAGKLNQTQIDQITLLDQQITPICTGPLTADPTAATAQITAAITTLTITAAMKASQ